MPPGPQAGSPQACPESFCILGFDIVRVPLDASSAVHLRSPSRLTPDALLERLFRNVHHPGRGAGAACGSLEPPPARRFRGAYPHHQRSIASGRLIYIGLPSTFRGTTALWTVWRSDLTEAYTFRREVRAPTAP